LSDLKTKLGGEARAAGFSKMGICRPDAIPRRRAAAAFVDAGHGGQMTWMAERMHWRGDPTALWPEARSVIMLAEAYTPDEDPLANLDRPEVATISVYARNRDYHDLVKKRLKRVGRWLLDTVARERTPRAPEIKVFVDTAPVMEKPLAAAAGWAGRASTRTFWAAISATGSSSARSSPRWTFPPTRPRPTIAAPAAPVSTSARPMRSRPLTSSMRGAAFPT
jgi:epoxyqueuosine reductase